MWFGVHHPVGADGRRQQPLEPVSCKAELSFGQHRAQSGQKLAVKHPGQNAKGEEEVTGDATQREPSRDNPPLGTT
jgi:hypothetical protein